MNTAFILTVTLSVLAIVITILTAINGKQGRLIQVDMKTIIDYILCFVIKRLPPCKFERFLIRTLMKIRS